MITLVKPTTAPTDKSIPAVMMTNVSPIARMAVIARCRSRFWKLLGVAKLWVVKVSTNHINPRRATKVRLSSVPIRALFFVAVSRTASAASAVVVLLSALIVGYSPKSFFSKFSDDRY
jgi:hypothetical protein